MILFYDNNKGSSLFLIILILVLHQFCSSASSARAAAGKDFYGTLGLGRDCTSKDVKKAYRRLALRHHPDKVAPEDRDKAEAKFKEVARAYEILSDDGKRKLYDQYGEAGVDPNFSSASGGGPGPQPFHNFSQGSGVNDFASMFSGASTGGGGSGGGSVTFDLNEILQNFLGGNGGRNNSFSTGTNTGGAPSGFGRGPGPGMNFFSQQTPFSQQQQQGQQQRQFKKEPFTRPFHCTLEELATGCTKRLKVKNPITDPLTGQPKMMERIYTVKVKPGWKKGTKLHFQATKDGNFPPISFVLCEKKHDFFRRVNNDIHWNCKITQQQAEKGVKLKVPILMNTPQQPKYLEILMQRDNNEEIPIRHGQKKVVKGYGMPIKGGPGKGDLIIEFHIKKDVS